jgi:hypothetical protein
VWFVLVLQTQHLQGIHTYGEGTPIVDILAPHERSRTGGYRWRRGCRNHCSMGLLFTADTVARGVL